MARFGRIQLLQAPKDPAHPGDYEDACQFDAARGIAAIADGVASAMFSGIWAKLLVESVVAAEPRLSILKPERPDEEGLDAPPPDTDQLSTWLQNCRRDWHRKIDFRSLNFFQFEKLKQSGGAFSTLLWVDLGDATETDAEPGTILLRCAAMGDGNLFHFRDGQLRTSFPMAGSAEYDLAPHALCSMKSDRDAHLAWLTHHDECAEGDLLVLCTDAVGQWIHQQREAGVPIDWDRLWQMTPTEWEAEVETLRAARSMRTDDATLLMLTVTTREKPAEIQATEWETASADSATDHLEAESQVEDDAAVVCDARPADDQSGTALPLPDSVETPAEPLDPAFD